MAFSTSRPTDSMLRAYSASDLTDSWGRSATTAFEVVLHVCTFRDVTLPNLPEFFQVGRVAVLGVFCPETDKPPLPVVLRVLVLRLGLGGQSKERFSLAVQLVNHLLGNAVPSDRHETDFPVRGAEVVHKLVALGFPSLG